MVLELGDASRGDGGPVVADTGVGDDDVEVGDVVGGFEGFDGAFGRGFGATFECDDDDGAGLVGWERG